MEDPLQEVRRILCNNTVHESLDYLASISRTIDESSTNLKAVIGGSYKDLIAACDRVVGMERTCQELLHLKNFLHEADAKALNAPRTIAGSASSSRNGTVPPAAGQGNLTRKGSLSDIVALIEFNASRKKGRRAPVNSPGSPSHAAGDASGATSGQNTTATNAKEHVASNKEPGEVTVPSAGDRALEAIRRRYRQDKHTDAGEERPRQGSGGEVAAAATLSVASEEDVAVLRLQEQFLSLEGFIASQDVVTAARILSDASEEITARRRSAQAPHAASLSETVWQDLLKMREDYARQILFCIKESIKADADAVVLATVTTVFYRLKETQSTEAAAAPNGQRGGETVAGSQTNGNTGTDHDMTEKDSFAPQRAEEETRVLERIADEAVQNFHRYHEALVLLRPSRGLLQGIVPTPSSARGGSGIATDGEGASLDARGFDKIVPGSDTALAALTEEGLFTTAMPAHTSAALVLAHLVRSILVEHAAVCKQYVTAHKASSCAHATDENAAEALREALQLPASLFGKQSMPLRSAAAQGAAKRAEPVGKALPARGVCNDALALHLALEAIQLHHALHRFLHRLSVSQALNHPTMPDGGSPVGGGNAGDGKERFSLGKGSRVTWQTVLDAKAAFFYSGSLGGETNPAVEGAGHITPHRLGGGASHATPSPGVSVPDSSTADVSRIVDRFLTPEKNLLRSAISSRAASPMQQQNAAAERTPSAALAIGGEAPSPLAGTGEVSAAAGLLTEAGKRERRRAYTRFMLGALSELTVPKVDEHLQESPSIHRGGEGRTSDAAEPSSSASSLTALRTAWANLATDLLLPYVEAVMTYFCNDPVCTTTFSMASHHLLASGAREIVDAQAQARIAALEQHLQEHVVAAGLRKSVERRVEASATALAAYLKELSTLPQANAETSEKGESLQSAPGRSLLVNTTTSTKTDVFMPLSLAVTALLADASSPVASLAQQEASGRASSSSQQKSAQRVLASLLQPDAATSTWLHRGSDAASSATPGSSLFVSALGLHDTGRSHRALALQHSDPHAVRMRGGSGSTDRDRNDGVPMLWCDRYPLAFFSDGSATAESMPGVHSPQHRDTEDGDHVSALKERAEARTHSAQQSCLCLAAKTAFLEQFAHLVDNVHQLPALFDVQGSPSPVTGSLIATTTAAPTGVSADSLLTPLVPWLRAVVQEMTAAQSTLSTALNSVEDLHEQQKDSEKAGTETSTLVVTALARVLELSQIASAMRTGLSLVLGAAASQRHGGPSSSSTTAVSDSLKATMNSLQELQQVCEARWQALLRTEYRNGLVAIYQRELAALVQEDGTSGVGLQHEQRGGKSSTSSPHRRPLPRTLFRLQHAHRWRRLNATTGGLSAPPAHATETDLTPVTNAASGGPSTTHAVYAPVQITGTLNVLLFSLISVLHRFDAYVKSARRDYVFGTFPVRAAEADVSSAITSSRSAVVTCVSVLLVTTAEVYHRDIADGMFRSWLSAAPENESAFADVWLQLYLDSNVGMRVWSTFLKEYGSHTTTTTAREDAPQQLLTYLASLYDALTWRSAHLADVLNAHAASILQQCALSFGLPSLAGSTLHDASLGTPTAGGEARAVASSQLIPLAIKPHKEVERFSLLPISSGAPPRHGAALQQQQQPQQQYQLYGRSGLGNGGVAALHPSRQPSTQAQNHSSQPVYSQRGGGGGASYEADMAGAAGRAPAGSGGLTGANANALASSLWGSTQRGWSTLWGQQTEPPQ